MDILILSVVLSAVISGWRKGFTVSMFELGLFTDLVPVKYQHTIQRRISGIFPARISAFLYPAIFGTLLLGVPVYGLTNHVGGTLLEKFSPEIRWLSKKASSMFESNRTSNREMLSIDPESEKFYRLNYTVTDTRVRLDLENKMMILVNNDRRRAGLDTLVVDPDLQNIARRYSAEMFARGYFSHYTPEGKSPFDRMKEAGIKYSHAGENLAMAPTLNIAYQALMNSPGHRANILRPSYNRVGIGVIDGGSHGLMISQEFRN